MSTTKILKEQRAEFDKLNNQIKDFCKKNNYSYLLSVGDYHIHDDVGLHALCRKLLEGEVGRAIIIAMLESGKEYYDAMTASKSAKH